MIHETVPVRQRSSSWRLCDEVMNGGYLEKPSIEEVVTSKGMAMERYLASDVDMHYLAQWETPKIITMYQYGVSCTVMES